MDEQNNNAADIKPVCPVCHQPVSSEQYFCPNCGNNLREKPKSISLLVQVGMYALAIFLPPLGLWPGAKYMMKKSRQAKIVGMVTIILTIISSVITIWAIFALFNSYLSQVNDLMYGM